MSDGNGIRISIRNEDDNYSIATGGDHTFVLGPLIAHFLEFEDVHFNHDSCVLIADHRDTESTDDDDSDGANADHDHRHVTALAIIGSAIRHANENPDQKLLLTGHADRSGPSSYNLALSRRRAENLLFVLKGDRESWRQHCKPRGHHEVEDYQQLLAWMFHEHGWETDPGPITDRDNPQTKAAVKKFQEQYNFEFAEDISEDGIVGAQTWGAFFDIYERELASIMDVTLTELREMQQRLVFMEDERPFVGCGEEWPKTDLNRSRTDRRVELYFFDPAELPTLPMPCHPNNTTCNKDSCELYNGRRFERIPLPVEPILPPRYRCPVHLRMTWLDPEFNSRPLPQGLKAKLRFGDDSAGREVEVAEDGVLDFVVDNRKQSFTLHFEHEETVYFATPPAGSTDPDRIIPASDAADRVRDGWRLFRLPARWGLDNCDWSIDPTAAPFYTEPFFEDLELIEEVGRHDAPVSVELDPHWQYMKFLYFDRKIKKKLSVPPLMVEGFADRDAAGAAPDTASNWTTTAEASQALPWLIRKNADGETPNPTSKCALQFRSKAQTFIDATASTAGDATGAGRKLVTKNRGAATSDVGCNEGDDTNHDFDKAEGARLAYYDLPPLWKSRHYHVRVSTTEAGRFETFAGRATSDSDPLLFSLDDLVLTNASLQPIDWLPDETPRNRVALFSNTFANGTDLSAVGLYKEDSGNAQSYFSERPQVETDRNYIADYPDWVRLVVTRGNLFDVFDRRVDTGPDGPVGARAAVLWLDATSSANFVPHKQSGESGEMDSRPAPHDQSFFSIQPMYEVRHHEWWDRDDRTSHRGIGRYDQALLRCCDVAADGTTEIARCLGYFRFFFNFAADFGKDDWLQDGRSGAAARQWSNDAIANLLKRWNGPDAWSTGPARLVPQSGVQLEAKTLIFAQDLPSEIAHYELGVFKHKDNAADASKTARAYMSALNGQGALDKADNVPKGSGWFTFAHEVGHGFSLHDEYVEQTYGSSSTKAWLLGFDCFSPGSPYEVDDDAMMNANRYLDSRSFWHVAEWLEARLAARGTAATIDVVTRGRTYKIPKHANAPRQNHICWPLREKLDQTRGPHGRFDVHFYPLGAERLSAQVLPARVSKPGAFDGLISIVVKLKFDFHLDPEDDSNETKIDSWLDNVQKQIDNRFNDKFVASGTFGGRTYNRILIDFSPRYWVVNPGKDLSKEDPNDEDAHIEIDMKASGAIEWDSGIIFEDEHELHFPFDKTPSDFARKFAEMVGMTAANHLTPSAYNATIQSVLPGGRVSGV